MVRLAGNFVDDNGLASIEFGASVLGASLIMVLGHDQCGAVKAAVDVVTKNAQLPGHLPELIAHLKAAVEKAQKEEGSLLDNAIRDNVLLNVETLRNSEPVLSNLIKENRLRVVGGLYDKHVMTVEQIGGISSDEFKRLYLALVRLERFWTDQIRYRL